MADTYYAWSPIRGGDAEKAVNIKRGEKVTQSQLGVDDAEWQGLIDSNAVRSKEFPAPADYEGSALDYLREKLEEAQAASAVEEEEAASELASVSTPPEAPAVTPVKETPSSTTKK
jgi:hypothetical protein